MVRMSCACGVLAALAGCASEPTYVSERPHKRARQDAEAIFQTLAEKPQPKKVSLEALGIAKRPVSPKWLVGGYSPDESQQHELKR